ncbi:hypothetical protein [Waddlia chondrophila]|nr:hypothetical protein [Waddlia chondrophila]
MKRKDGDLLLRHRGLDLAETHQQVFPLSTPLEDPAPKLQESHQLEIEEPQAKENPEKSCPLRTSTVPQRKSPHHHIFTRFFALVRKIIKMAYLLFLKIKECFFSKNQNHSEIHQTKPLINKETPPKTNEYQQIELSDSESEGSNDDDLLDLF